MKKCFALLLLLLGPVAGAAGSRAVTSAAMGDGLTRYTIIWTSDGSGAVDGDLGGDGWVWPLEHTERERGAVLLEFDCEGGR